MRYKNEEVWDRLNEIAQTDQHLRKVLAYADAWANMMEFMQESTRFEFSVIAERAAKRTAGHMLLSGNQAILELAALILAEVWWKGDQLRTWNQKRYKLSSDS